MKVNDTCNKLERGGGGAKVRIKNSREIGKKEGWKSEDKWRKVGNGMRDLDGQIYHRKITKFSKLSAFWNKKFLHQHDQ